MSYLQVLGVFTGVGLDV